MATKILLSVSKGCRVSLLAKHSLSKPQNVVCKTAFATTSAARERVYGPIEPGMPSVTSHWKTERVVTVALLPLIPAALAFPTAVLDMGLSTFLVLHTHWGLTGVLTDYVHGTVLKPVLMPLVLLLSVLAFAGLCLLNMNDIGFARSARKIFSEL